MGRILENSIRFPHLLRAEILDGLDASFKKAFLNKCVVKVYAKPTVILEQGEHAFGMILIAHGYVDISFIGEGGQHMFLARAKAGDALGETETISEEPCAASGETSANTTILYCAAPNLGTALQNPGFIKNLTKISYKRLVYDNWVKHNAQFGDVGQRLRGYLYILSGKADRIRETQSYLANVVGCSRQTINRELAVLRAEGLIAQRGSEIEILDRKALGRGLDA